MTDSTPSVPDSAALAEEILKRYLEHRNAVYQDEIEYLTEALNAFGRAQYERGVRDAAEICDAMGEVEKRAVIWQLADRIRALLSPSEGATEP